MSRIFNYVESDQELRNTITNYKKYYQCHKDSFSNESLCESIATCLAI